MAIFFGKNTFSYVYIHGKNFKKVEKSCFSQCPGFLQLPISAIGFSPNWVNLEPTYSVCLAHKGLNSPKSCTVGQSTTILYCWEPLGASLDQFGPLWSDLRAQSKILGPVWSQFLTCFAIQKGLKGPKLCTVGQSITMLYWWGPLGAFLDHFGPFGAQLEAP